MNQFIKVYDYESGCERLINVAEIKMLEEIFEISDFLLEEDYEESLEKVKESKESRRLGHLGGQFDILSDNLKHKDGYYNVFIKEYYINVCTAFDGCIDDRINEIFLYSSNEWVPATIDNFIKAVNENQLNHDN